MIKRRLIELIKEYQYTQSEDCYQEIINIFSNLINKYVNKADVYDREDLKQEILIRIHIVLLKFKITETEKDESQFKKYLEITIKNMYIDYKRKQKNKEILFNDENMIIKNKDKN